MEKTKTPEKQQTRRPRWLRWSGLVLAGLLILFGSWLLTVLSSGPVSVPMLASIMADRASTGPAHLTVVDAQVDFTGEEGLRVIVKNAHLAVSGEVPVNVTLPQVEAPVDLSALLSGKIHFSSLTIDRPLVSVGLKPGGNAKLPGMKHLMEAVNRVSNVVDDEFARRQLEHVEIRNGEIEIQGPLTRKFSGIDAKLTRSSEMAIRANARVAGRVTPWTIDFVRENSASGKYRRIAVLVQDIALAEIAKPDAVPKPRRGLGIPLATRFESQLSDDGTFLAASLVGQATEGLFHIGPTPIRFNDVAVWFEWVGDDPKIRIRRSHAINGETKLLFSGLLTPPATQEEDWLIDLRSEMVQLGASDVPLPPFMLDRFTLEGRFESESRTLYFDKVSLSAGRANAAASGSVQIRKDGPYVALAIEGEAVPVGLAKHMWPVTLVPPARRWVLERIKTGLIEKASAVVSLRPPAFDRSDPDPGWSGDDLKVDLSFRDGRVAPVGSVPDAYSLSGDLKVENEVMTVRAKDGLIYTGGGARVDVPDVMFQIHRLTERENKFGVVDVEMAGGAKEIGRIFDSAPFKVLQRTDIRPAALAGDGTARVRAEFPMRKKIDLSMVEWQAEAVSADFSLTEPVRGHKIENADIMLRADSSQVAITGKGKLDGLPADIDLLFPLGGSNVSARQGVVLEVTAAQLKEKDIDLTAFLEGPMTMTVDDSGGDKVFDVDLTKTTLRLEALGWSKGRGVPANATFRLVELEDERQIQDFHLVSDGVDVNGSMTVSNGGELLTASFARFQLRAGDEASVSIQRASNGRYKVAMVGDAFDARGLIRQVRKPQGTATDKSFADKVSVTASIDRVTGYNGVRLDNFTGRIESGSGGVTKVDIDGKLDGRSSFQFRLEPAGTAQVATGSFGDAGAALKFLDLYERMRGGTGQLQVNMHDTKTWDGSFIVQNMSITEDAALRQLSSDPRIFREDDDRGRNRAVAARQSGESSFETLDIYFTRAGDTLSIQKGALTGAVFGGTVVGTVDLKSQTMDLTGTFVPIYALNNFFSKIPLLGFALGGASGEGLIGVTYRISGELENPTLRVNPISAIAPGIFRKMFEFR